MQKNLFHELYLIFQEEVSNKMTKWAFIQFVFNISDNSDSEFAFLDDRTFYRYYNMETHLSDAVCDYLTAIDSRPIQQLLSSYGTDNTNTLLSLQKRMRKLCDSNAISYDHSDNTFDGLFNLIIAKHIENDNLANEKQHNDVKKSRLLSNHNAAFKKLFVHPCKNYIPHPSEEEIIKCLKQAHILFLYSFYGTGKTELTKSIIANHKNYGFNEVASIKFTESVSKSLEQIKFGSSFPKYSTSIPGEQILEQIKRKDSGSLLIINKLSPSEEVINECFSLFNGMDITVLITIDANFLTFSDGMTAWKLECLPFDSLKKIFEQSSGSSISDEIAEEFFSQLEYHPLAITLLGKVFSNHKTCQETFFQDFPTTPIKDLNSRVVKYKGEKVHILTHLNSIMSFDNFLTSEEWEAIRSLSLLNGLQINRELLLKWFSNITNSTLESLCQKGILIEDDSSRQSIRMHRIISDIILYQLDFKNILAHNITRRKSNTPSAFSLLLNISETITNCWDYPYDALQLQELSFSVFKILDQHSIRFKTNKNQSHYSHEGNCWLLYCFKCIHFYQDYGNTDYAQKILDKICSSYSGIELPFFLKIEKEMNQAFVKWQTQKLDTIEVTSLLYELQNYCSNCNPTEIRDQLPPILYRMITINLDRLILCMKNDIFNEQYLYCLREGISTLEKLVNSFTNLNHLQKRFFTSIYSIWTQPICDETIKNIVDTLLPIASDRPTQVRLLCDAVYMKSHLCRLAPKDESLSELKELYRKTTDLFDASQNLPSYIQLSYTVASLYYALCFPKDKNLLTEVLMELPLFYQNIVRFSDIAEYSNTRHAILHVLETLFSFPDF